MYAVRNDFCWTSQRACLVIPDVLSERRPGRDKFASPTDSPCSFDVSLGGISGVARGVFEVGLEKMDEFKDCYFWRIMFSKS